MDHTPRRRLRWIWIAVLLATPAPAQERTVADVYSAGDVAAWSFELAGEPFGATWSRYDGPLDLAGVRAHAFHAWTRLEHQTPSGLVVQRMTADLWTDDAGSPLRVDFRTVVGEASAGVDVVIAGTRATATIRQGPQPKEHAFEVVPGTFALANNFLSHLELALALRLSDEAAAVEFPMVSVNMLQGLTLKVAPQEGGDGEEGVRVWKDSLGEVLHIDAERRLVRLELPAQGVVIRRVAEHPEPFTIELPRPPEARADFDSEEVAIAYDGVSLAGTVTRRKGAEGRLPAVLFVSGSGLQDRDGFAAGIDVGTHEILDRLTEEGFLVLRVDDRGAGGSTGPTEGMTYDDLVEDARRCVLWLRERPDVDPARVVVIGHSEGGMTAPILAAELDWIAAIVLMAGPGRSIEALVREQLQYGESLEGASSEELERLGTATDAFFARVAAGEPVEAADLPVGLAALVPALPWVKSHLGRDPLGVIARVRCPVLVLQGARDIQVSVERDARPLEAALDAAGNADHELVVFERLDHLFKRTSGEESTGLDYLKTRPVDAEFLDRLAAWLGERLQPSRR